MIIQTIFWILVIIILYSYIGYPVFLYILALFKKAPSENTHKNLPDVTLFIAAYNEKQVIDEKVKNCREINYPKDKLHILWVTDGSDDGSENYLKQFEDMHVMHKPEREGKTGAINRGMTSVNTEITVFTDANTMINSEAIQKIVQKFNDKQTGCVAGEKRIFKNKQEKAVGAGEGIYWRYESFIKYYESIVNSVIGAVGELFAIRTDLFTPLEKDTLIDDFMISMRIAMKGKKIDYAPSAYAYEYASATIKEEMKRKIRIASGGFQAIYRLKHLFNPLKYKLLSVQFISHKFLRWAIIPFALPLVLISNALLINSFFNPGFYEMLFLLQLFFYLLVIAGCIFQTKNSKIQFLFAPYYMIVMNYSAILGLFRYLSKSQSVNWEKARRAN